MSPKRGQGGQRDDRWERRAGEHGYRSRAVWKLLDMQKRMRLFSAGQCVVELGAAPGGWSQALTLMLGEAGKLIAVDIMDMQPVNGVTFVHGDFRDADTQEQIKRILGKRKIDLVISDMSPDISGVRATDDYAIVSLNEDTIRFAKDWAHCRLCLMKSFQCEDLRERVELWRSEFGAIRILKPLASRTASREQYLLISGLNAKSKASK
jgi:23S rRNA (uridine2552-2'-O)-methyltransferase